MLGLRREMVIYFTTMKRRVVNQMSTLFYVMSRDWVIVLHAGIYIYIMHSYMYISVYIYIHTNARIYICMCMYMYMYLYMYMHMCTDSMCIYIYTLLCVYIYTYIICMLYVCFTTKPREIPHFLCHLWVPQTTAAALTKHCGMKYLEHRRHKFRNQKCGGKKMATIW